VPLSTKLRSVFPNAAFLLPDGTFPFDGGGNGRQWFSIRGVTEENRSVRVAEVMSNLHDIVQQAQNRFSVLQSDTALVGFSQGAIMALEFSKKHDGKVGRVLSFSGRFATLPDKAPELTTLHFLHGESDPVISVAHARSAYDRLIELEGDATLDVASSVGHEIHPVLADKAIQRLQTCIPLRSWKKALEGA
jgi:phospholipase/carboxylesterase